MVEGTESSELVIIGAGATGIEFADMARLVLGDELRIMVVDDDHDVDLAPWHTREIEYLGDRSQLYRVDAPYLVAVGRCEMIRELTSAAEHAGLVPAQAIVHPSAVLGRGTTIGAGTVVYPQAATSTNVHIGRHVQIHLGVTLGHDTVIGERCVLTPGTRLSGGCQLGDDVFVGTGAVVVPGTVIGPRTTVGAGSVVTRDLPSDVVAFGSPAKPRP